MNQTKLVYEPDPIWFSSVQLGGYLYYSDESCQTEPVKHKASVNVVNVKHTTMYSRWLQTLIDHWL